MSKYLTGSSITINISILFLFHKKINSHTLLFSHGRGDYEITNVL